MTTKTTIFKDMIEQHRSEQYFAHRSNQLILLRSYHLFPIEKYALGSHPMIMYKVEQKGQTLHDLIEARIALSSTTIKSFIWQLTKFMMNCEEKNINHLRLYPRAIVLAEKYSQDQSFFIYIKDFCLGKQFQTVKQGKVLQIFEYLHPELSVMNQFFHFNIYNPSFDIWSLGVILYKLVYFQSPFCKQGKSVYSKTILREYREGKYKIAYKKNEYSSINRFIAKCLDLTQEQGLRFGNWKEIKQYILVQQQIYNYLDFHDEYFEEMAKIHTKFMIFMSQMYCMVIDQCRDSPNLFWKRAISQQITTPFQILICQFTLSLMMMAQERFYSLYSGHLFLLKPTTRANLKNISERLQNEVKFMEDKWIEPKFKQKAITLDIIHLIQDICVRFNLQASQQSVNVEMSKRVSEEDFDSNKITEMRSSVVRKKDSRNSKDTIKKSMVWRSVQILFDYCTEMVNITSLTTKRQKFKFIFEELYINTTFSTILVNEFHYNEDLSEVFKKVYKEYLQP